jgi:hypothetical protein
MKLVTRLILMITIVVTLTNMIEFYHLMRNPAHLTLPFSILVSAVTVVPIAIVILYWHRRNWL